MNPNEYWLVQTDKDQKTYHMITLDGWTKKEPVVCGKRYKVLSHARYNPTRILLRKRCGACFVLSCLE